jgi:EmrB/QacA subfamily drug resistance transporter
VNRRLVLLACILGSAIAFLDQTVVNVALPSIRDDLDTGLAEQQWVVESYLLTLGALLLVGGSLGDILGRRRVFEMGLVGFGATSLLCALAPNAELLIVARGLQGAAGALLVPSSLALITGTFPPAQRGAAIGSWTAWTGVAFVLGPLGGGALIEFVSWRWIFAINVPLVVLNVLVVRLAVPAVAGEARGRRVDWEGATLCALGLAGPVFALIEQPRRGWGDPLVWFPLLGGFALLAAFVWHERRAREPMLPLEMFRARNFTVGNLATLTIYGGLGVATFFMTIYLQQVAGYSAIAAGMALVPITVVMWLLSKRFGALADRLGPRWFMGIGPIVAAAGFAWTAAIGIDVDYWTDLLPGVTLFGLGLAITVAPLTAAVLAAAGEEHAGVASGANNAIARVASLLAIAAVGAIAAARFDGALDERLAGERLSPGERQALADVRDEPLAGGAEGAPRLDDDVRQASLQAYRTGIGVAAGLVALGGLISLAGIGNPPRQCQDAANERRAAAAVA